MKARSTSRSSFRLGLTEDYVEKWRASLESMPTRVGSLFPSSGDLWLTGSPAANEAASLPGFESTSTAYSLACVGITIAADHMWGLNRALQSPIPTFAPWTLARGVLEATSLSVWLTDPTITPTERAARAINVRLRSLREQDDFLAAPSQGSGELKADERKKIPARVHQALEEARQLGLLVSSGRRPYVGAPIPSATALAEQAFQAEETFRLLSGMAHGRTWAGFSLGFKRVEGQPAITQHMEPEAYVLLCMWCFGWFAEAAARYFVRCLDADQLRSLLEEESTLVGLSPATAAWATVLVPRRQ